MLQSDIASNISYYLCISIASLLLALQSDIARIDMSSSEPKVTGQITGVGDKAHGLVQWHDEIIMLDSENSALVSVEHVLGQDEERDVPARPRLLWKVIYA